MCTRPAEFARSTVGAWQRKLLCNVAQEYGANTLYWHLERKRCREFFHTPAISERMLPKGLAFGMTAALLKEWQFCLILLLCCSPLVLGICGDSVVEVGETCDDGNVVSGDGCSASCILEANYHCIEPTSTNYMFSCSQSYNFSIIGVERYTSLDILDQVSYESLINSNVHADYLQEDSCVIQVIRDNSNNRYLLLSCGKEDLNGNATLKDLSLSVVLNGPAGVEALLVSDDPGEVSYDASLRTLNAAWKSSAYGTDGFLLGPINATHFPIQFRSSFVQGYQHWVMWNNYSSSSNDGTSNYFPISHTSDVTCYLYDSTSMPSNSCFRFGNGQVDPSEECDDGNVVSGDGCSATGRVESNYSCNGAPSTCQTCGNGIVEGSETCDLGNSTDSQNGCSADSCTTVEGWTCNGQSPSLCVKCGNGIVEWNETCDDGNLVVGDGCTATCEVEPGSTCVGAPLSVCEGCQNGLVEGVEECDDRNDINLDGCSQNCTIQLVPILQGLQPTSTALAGRSVTLQGLHFSPIMQVGIDALPGTMLSLQIEDTSQAIVQLPPLVVEGYHSLSIFDDRGRRITTLTNAIYYTASSCVDEGMYEPSQAGGECQSCQKGGECPGGGRILPQAGYWNDGDRSGYVCECAVPEACPGGSSNTCAEGYSGQCCQDCVDGYYRRGEYCEKCGDDTQQEGLRDILILLAGYCGYVVLLLLALVLAREKYMDMLTICLVLLQMVTLSSQNIVSQFPSFATILPSLSSIVLMRGTVTGSECLVGQHAFLLLFMLTWLVFFSLVVAAALLTVILFVGRAIALPSNLNLLTGYYTLRFGRIFLILCTLMYLILTFQAMQSMICVQKEGHVYWPGELGVLAPQETYTLLVDSSVVCYEGSYWIILALAVVTITLVTVLFPLLVLIALAYMLITRKRNSPKFTYALGLFYENFRLYSGYYFMFALFAVVVVLVVYQALFFYSNLLACMLLLLTMWIFGGSTLICLPIKTVWINGLVAWAAIAVICNSVLSLFTEMRQHGSLRLAPTLSLELPSSLHSLLQQDWLMQPMAQACALLSLLLLAVIVGILVYVAATGVVHQFDFKRGSLDVFGERMVNWESEVERRRRQNAKIVPVEEAAATNATTESETSTNDSDSSSESEQEAVPPEEPRSIERVKPPEVGGQFKRMVRRTQLMRTVTAAMLLRPSSTEARKKEEDSKGSDTDTDSENEREGKDKPKDVNPLPTLLNKAETPTRLRLPPLPSLSPSSPALPPLKERSVSPPPELKENFNFAFTNPPDNHTQPGQVAETPPPLVVRERPPTLKIPPLPTAATPAIPAIPSPFARASPSSSLPGLMQRGTMPISPVALRAPDFAEESSSEDD